MAYLELAELTSYVASELASDQPFLADVLAAAEAAVNDHCARHFNPPSGGATARLYVPDGDVVITHDFIDATGITITDDDVAVPLTDVQLEPVNSMSWTGAAQPFYRIRRTTGCWTRDGDKATVSVTSAKWGWPAVPPEVTEATRILAKDLAHTKSVRFGVAGIPDVGGAFRVRENPQVMQLLSKFRHPMAIGLA